MTRWLASAALVAAAAAVSPPASAASFNCAFAGLPTEFVICQVASLGRADEAMAAQYFALIGRAPPDVAVAIRAEQRDWLAERNTCRYDAQCILRAYNARLDRLREWRDEFENAEEPGDDGQPSYGEEEQPGGAMGDGPDGDEEYDSFGPESDPGDEVVPYEDPSGDAD